MRPWQTLTMKTFFYSFLLSILLLSLIPSSSSKAQGNSTDEEPESGTVVCAPEVYLADPGDCLPAGPSVYLGEIARLGLTIPERPLPASKPDKELVPLPFLYFKLG